MATNPIASLFLVKVINCYDDTVSAKKYIVNDLVTNFEELIIHTEQQVVQKLYAGLFSPLSKQVFNIHDIEAFEVSREHSTSVKNDEIR